MPKKYNRYDLSGEYGIGYCTNTGREFYFDLEDYDKIKDYTWYEHRRTTGYHALETMDYSYGKHTLIMTHLLGFPCCDHINRNSLDNRKSNLRPCTCRQNNCNVSLKRNSKNGVLGVTWVSSVNRWMAYINLPPVNGKIRRRTRYFALFKDAVHCRLEMEQQIYGEFAPQKHLYAEYGIKGELNG